MPCGTTFVDVQGKAPRILSAEMPSHSLSLTQTYGPDTGRVARAVHLSLGGPFAAPLSAGIPASPALCKCALRFDLRFIGLQQHHNAFFRACQGWKCISNVFPILCPNNAENPRRPVKGSGNDCHSHFINSSTNRFFFQICHVKKKQQKICFCFTQISLQLFFVEK